jgi:4-hydroxy-tetrahydrodipicolinate synthase
MTRARVVVNNGGFGEGLTMSVSFAGAGVALVTPFGKDGGLDEEALRKLVRRQVEGGIDVLVPCGTTGETVTLSDDEQKRVVETTLEERGGRPVLAGASSNDTRAAVAKTKAMASLGVHGILSVAPYYNKPTAEGLFRHFSAVADASPVPVIVYNVPGRTASNIDTKTLLRLAEHPNVAGIKEASGNIAQQMDILRDAPARFLVLSGDDAVTLPLMALGAKGLISVVANQVPRDIHDLVAACAALDFTKARQIHNRLLPLMNLNFIESNPIPVKASLALLGLCEESFRLPLVPPSEETRTKLRAALRELGLLR